MASRPEILIAGGGIGGMTAALALARRGFPVRLFERAQGFGEVGAGLQLGPNAMRVMAALGLGEAVSAAGFRPRATEIRRWNTGLPVFRLPLDADGAPYVQIHRADLISLLLNALRAAGVTLRTGAEVTAHAQGPDGVEIALADGSRHSGAALIGADGLGSARRGQMLGPEQARFTGQVAWRATVPAEDLPRGLVAPSGTVWAGPGRHVVSYFLRGGRLVNVVAVEERADWLREGWMQPGDPDELRAAFAGWHPRVAGLLAAVRSCFLWALYDRDPLPRWTEGRVALLGDACHPMLPFLAQGAAMAIEDAWVLAERLDAGPVAEALVAYEAARLPRTARVQNTARENAHRFHRRGTIGCLMAFGPMTLATWFAPWILRGRIRWLYEHDVTASPVR